MNSSCCLSDLISSRQKVMPMVLVISYTLRSSAPSSLSFFSLVAAESLTFSLLEGHINFTFNMSLFVSMGLSMIPLMVKYENRSVEIDFMVGFLSVG